MLTSAIVAIVWALPAATRFRCTNADGSSEYAETPCSTSQTCLAWAGNKWSAEACEEAKDPRPADFRGDWKDSCRRNFKCWTDQHDLYAVTACETAVERTAKYEYRWENGWTEPKFHTLKWSEAAGTITFGGTKIAMQNGFGAWRKMKYVCIYDPIDRRIVDLAVQPLND